MKITINIARQISQCHKTWDDLLPEGHHLKSRHLQAFENAGIEDIENNYLQVYLKDKLIGLLYLQQFRFRHRHVHFSRPASILSKLVQLILPAHVPLLICGNLFRIDYQGFYFTNPAQQHLVFDAIELFIRQNKIKPAGIIVKDCATAFLEQNTRLFKYRFFNGDVTMELNRRANWLQFDDYINDLHKNYRQRAKKIMNAFAGIQIKELDAGGIIELASAIEKLYWNVVNKQTIKLGTVNAAYFYTLKTDLQHNFEFYAMYLDNRMVGFYTFIFYDTRMETHYIGLDYEANKKYKLYFNILFLSIQKMITQQYDILELGRTSREAKLNLGAMPKQIFNYIKLSNPLVKFTVYYLLNRFNKTANHNQSERNPLK